MIVDYLISPLLTSLLFKRQLTLQSYNRYAYTWNNPLRYTDPSGFFQEEGGDHAGEAEGRANIESGRYDSETGDYDEKGNAGSKEGVQRDYEKALKNEQQQERERETRDRANRIEHVRQQRMTDAQRRMQNFLTDVIGPVLNVLGMGGC